MKIRLTESKLKRIVKESVKNVLNEISSDKAIAAHKKAQDDYDRMGYSWWDDIDSDEKYNRRERQIDKFADYAQNKGAEYYPYGLIGWYTDDSDGVFDHSSVVFGETIDDVPDDGYGTYALTREGQKVFDKWKDDVSCGYSLGSGRAKGLANSIGSGEWDLWEYLTNDKYLSKRIK